MDPQLQAAIDRFRGFAALYDSVRPRVPDLVVDVVCSYLSPRGSAVRVVVDLGSGTGLSARPWARLQPPPRVVCVDPNEDMLGQARRAAAEGPSPGLFEFVCACADRTGLPTGCADVVQIARLLRPGGVLALVDCGWSPVIPGCWRSERAFEEAKQAGDRVSAERGLTESLRRWSGHEESLRTLAPPGALAWVRQVLLHAEEEGDAARLVALAESQGGVQTALRGGATREELGLDALERTASCEMGEAKSAWLWGYSVLLGLRA
eukprot:m51a1_g5822 hypothetical protein (264) ;mRNA; f:233696-234619